MTSYHYSWVLYVFFIGLNCPIIKLFVMPKLWVLLLLLVLVIYPYAHTFLRNYGPYVAGQLALSLQL